MSERRKRWWLYLFVPGTLFVFGPSLVSQLSGFVLAESIRSLFTGIGFGLLFLSLLTQLSLPRRRKKPK